MDEGPLAVALDRVRQQERALRARETIERQLAEVSRRLPDLSENAAARRRDADRLRGFTVAAVLVRVRGERGGRLAAAVAAAEAAQRDLDEQQARRRALIAERADVDRELAGLRDAGAAYEMAVADAERDLTAAADPRGGELVALNDRVAALRATARGHERALRAGGSALQQLGYVLDRLGRAENWSTVDLFLGNITDIWEHARLAEAKEAAWGAQRSLDLFAREVADLGMPADPPPMGKISASWFVDMMVDGLVVDLLKHRRIERAHDRVAAARRWVLVSTTRIEHAQRAATKELAQLTKDRDRLLQG